MLKTPILFLIYNRPEHTKLVFSEIQTQRPQYLFIAADGPNDKKFNDTKLCDKTREIVSNINWECQVKTLFRKKNLGCKEAVSSAIDWFFDNVNEGIILEDDCLPDKFFFGFCEKLLNRYKNDSRIMLVSGNNFQNGRIRGDGNYYFSIYNHIWGWASWKRAWKYYDVKMRSYPKFKNQGQLVNVIKNLRARKYWSMMLQDAYEGKIDTWDCQWTYAIWTQNGLSVLPNANLVKNIGFGPNATHTRKPNKNISLYSKKITNIVHPSFVLQNSKADHYYESKLPFTRYMLRKMFNHMFISTLL